ncbi:tetraspanin-32 isoform X1 [Phyllostomus hastatus]|uniref:tetraspanin-32 isoform X1 n=1 Tax=Phyllostomus hastatus TaxID=9423 RepID=UPI001E67E423|nr:tetraspanin-32 isoform X1 [Phyllostomus hastatus]
MLVTSFFVLVTGSLLHGDQPGRAPRPGGRAECRGRRAGGPTPHGRGLPVLRAGVLRPGAGGLLETPQPHPGGGRRVGHLRPGLRPGVEEPAWRLATGAAGHPGHVPVLREELAFRPAGRRGGRPVSGSQGCLAGLPAGHPEPPEDTRTGRLHPGQRGPRLHGVRNAAQLLPVVCHLLRPQPGPQRDLCPEPPSPRPADPGAQPLQTLRGGARLRPASAGRPGPWRTLGEPPAAPGPLTLCADPLPATCLPTGAWTPPPPPRAPLGNEPGPPHRAGVGEGSPARGAAPCAPTGPGSPTGSPEQAGSWSGAGEPGGLCREAQAPQGHPGPLSAVGPQRPSRLPPQPPPPPPRQRRCGESCAGNFSDFPSPRAGQGARPSRLPRGPPVWRRHLIACPGVPCAPAPPGSHSACLGNRDCPRWGQGLHPVLRPHSPKADGGAPCPGEATAQHGRRRGEGGGARAASSTEGHQAWPTKANQGGPPSGDVQPGKGQAPVWSPTVSQDRPPEHRCARLHCTQLSARPVVLSWSSPCPSPCPVPHEISCEQAPARQWGQGRGKRSDVSEILRDGEAKQEEKFCRKPQTAPRPLARDRCPRGAFSSSSSSSSSSAPAARPQPA